MKRQPLGGSDDQSQGFTLVEIMVAIVIIAILIGLLLPAVNKVRLSARIQAVKADMEKLNTALTQFKTRFGVDVPGSITLYERSSDWSQSGEASRSRGVIRQLWPQFDFSADVDLNDNNVMTDSFSLDGSECLVFFLGGRIDLGNGSNNTGALVGFSRNPSSPFSLGGNREGPFFEFKGSRDPGTLNFTGRLSDTNSNYWPEYLDPIQGQINPYVYFANGYRTGTPIAPSTYMWVHWDNWLAGTQQRIPRAYCQPPVDNSSSQGALRVVPHNRSGHQIISPGFDHEYGTGGEFDASNDQNNGAMSPEDRDNITNFHPGMLAE